MKIVIADTLTASIAKLDPPFQDLVKQTVFDFQVNPKTPSFKYHRLKGTKDKNFWSIRANDDIRVIIHRSGDVNVLCYADHHDPAYRWAEKRKLEVHPDTGAAQFLVIDERVEEVVTRIVRQVVEEPPVFGSFEPAYLMALGVPANLLEAVRYIRQSRLEELIELLPEEAAERLLRLAEGHPVPRPVEIVVDPFSHPDARRRFKVVDNAEELREALEAGWEKWVVFLHPEQREAIEKRYSGPAKVSGSAGTGKTVVALHRAAHLARAGAGRVLLTTFSSTLASRLDQNIEHLLPREHPAHERLRVVHLHKLARDIWVEYNKRSLAIIGDKRVIDHHIQRAERAAGRTGFDVAFLRAEWEQVIELNDVQCWEDYRLVSRAGRGTPLGARQRKKLWDVFEQLRGSIGAAGLLSWDRVCHEVAALLAAHPEQQFRHVIADEVQDFGYADLVLLRALAGEGRDDLFLCGDPGQRIYKMRTSWAVAGINVRGRATRLKINYRTTEQIRRFSAGLRDPELVGGDGELEARDTISLLAGVDPEIRPFASAEQEIEGVADWLSELLKGGYSPRDIAIFARTEAVIGDRAEPALRACGLRYAPLRDEQHLAADCAAVGTMHRAKGLEFKVVVVMGCERGLMPLSVALRDLPDAADQAAALEQEKNLLYVACTRARERVLITCAGVASEFLGGA